MPGRQNDVIGPDVVQSDPAWPRLTRRLRVLAAALGMAGLGGLGLLVVCGTHPPAAAAPTAHRAPPPAAAPTPAHAPAAEKGIWEADWWPVATELGTPAAQAWRASHVPGDSDIGVLYAAQLPGGPPVAVLSGLEPSGNQVALLVHRAEGWVRLRTWHAPLVLPDTFTFLVPDSTSGRVDAAGHLLVLARNATTATITAASPGRADVTAQTLPLEHGALSVAVPDLSTVTRVVTSGRRGVLADVTPGNVDARGGPAPYIVASRAVGDDVLQVRTDGRQTVCGAFWMPMSTASPGDIWSCVAIADAPAGLLRNGGVAYGCGPADATSVVLTGHGLPPVRVRTVHGRGWTRSCFAWFGDETMISGVSWQR